MALEHIAEKELGVPPPSPEIEDGKRNFPDRPGLRKQIDEVCSTDADLNEFLTDYFFEIARKVSRGMDRTEKITALLSQADLAMVASNLSDYIATKQRLQNILVDGLRRTHIDARPERAVPKRHQRHTEQSKGEAHNHNKKWKRRKKFLTRLFTVNLIVDIFNLVLSRIADQIEATRYEQMFRSLPVPAMFIAAILCLSILTTQVQSCTHPSPGLPANNQRILQGYPTTPPYSPMLEPSGNSSQQ